MLSISDGRRCILGSVLIRQGISLHISWFGRQGDASLGKSRSAYSHRAHCYPASSPQSRYQVPTGSDSENCHGSINLLFNMVSYSVCVWTKVQIFRLFQNKWRKKGARGHSPIWKYHFLEISRTSSFHSLQDDRLWFVEKWVMLTFPSTITKIFVVLIQFFVFSFARSLFVVKSVPQCFIKILKENQKYCTSLPKTYKKKNNNKNGENLVHQELKNWKIRHFFIYFQLSAVLNFRIWVSP